MRVLVTGSAAHLGEALVRTLNARHGEIIGLDLLVSPFTTHIGSISDSDFVRRCMHGVDVVMHTATLHKPHVASHARRAFVETNVTGTLTILEAALAAGVSGVVFTSTSSVFGAALIPAEGQPVAWITEDEYRRRDWTMFPGIDRVYVNQACTGGTRLEASFRFPTHSQPFETR
jgi:nucleoside-diphosphate-sugar epimerase